MNQLRLAVDSAGESEAGECCYGNGAQWPAATNASDWGSRCRR